MEHFGSREEVVYHRRYGDGRVFGAGNQQRACVGPEKLERGSFGFIFQQITEKVRVRVLIVDALLHSFVREMMVVGSILHQLFQREKKGSKRFQDGQSFEDLEERSGIEDVDQDLHHRIRLAFTSQSLLLVHHNRIKWDEAEGKAFLTSLYRVKGFVKHQLADDVEADPQ